MPNSRLSISCRSSCCRTNRRPSSRCTASTVPWGSAYADPQGTVEAVHLDDGLLFVRQQDERQLILSLEFGMSLRGLGADSDDAQTGPLEIRMQITQGAGLPGATGGEVRWVEVQDHGAGAQQLGQRSILAGLVRQREFRRPFVGFDHMVLPPRPHPTQ